MVVAIVEVLALERATVPVVTGVLVVAVPAAASLPAAAGVVPVPVVSVPIPAAVAGGVCCMTNEELLKAKVGSA